MAQAIIKFMEDKDKYTATSSELHGKLKVVAAQLGVDVDRDKAWPKSARWLWRPSRFEELADKVLSGEVERGAGAVAGQLLNGARACVRDGLAAREQEELIERLEALEGALETKRGGSRWGA